MQRLRNRRSNLGYLTPYKPRVMFAQRWKSVLAYRHWSIYPTTTQRNDVIQSFHPQSQPEILMPLSLLHQSYPTSSPRQHVHSSIYLLHHPSQPLLHLPLLLRRPQLHPIPRQLLHLLRHPPLHLHPHAPNGRELGNAPFRRSAFSPAELVKTLPVQALERAALQQVRVPELARGDRGTHLPGQGIAWKRWFVVVDDRDERDGGG